MPRLAGIIDGPRVSRRPAEPPPAPNAGAIGSPAPPSAPPVWVAPVLKGGGVQPAPAPDVRTRLDEIERQVLEMRRDLLALSRLVATAIEKAFGL